MWTILVLAFVPYLQDAEGFSRGIPPKVCMNMFPKHHLQQQKTPSPFRITLNQTSYTPGDIIKISVSSPSGKTFRGFILRGRRLNGETEQLIGNFTKYPDDATVRSWYPLNEGENNCVCHSSNIDRESIEVEWQTPAVSVGDIEISGAFVHEFEEFWVTRNKLKLSATEPQNDGEYKAEITDERELEVSLEGCGDTKGCLLFPTACRGNGCRHVVTYKIDADKGVIDFEVKSQARGYASVSLSHDILMGTDETVSCVEQNGVVDFQFGYNPPKVYHNEQHLRKVFKDIVISRQGETLTCRYTRPLETKLGNETFNLGLNEEKFYLVYAWGDVYDNTTVIKHHYELPIVSKNKVNFYHNNVVSGSVFPIIYHAHAAMGIIAWIMLGCASVIVARHFKPTLKRTLGGTAIWFQVHRAFAVLILLLTIALIVIMFVYLKAWTKYATIHAILGLLSLGLLLVQSFAGLVRPGGSDSKRPYFNWGHRAGGLLAIIASAVSVVLGFNVSLVEEGLAWKETIIIIVWIAFHILFDMLLEIVKCSTEVTTLQVADKKANPSNMEMEEEAEKVSEVSPKTMFILLMLYILGNLVFCGLSLGYLFTS